ncbi:MAG: excinuclease ABC subunit UvrC [Candidatus ainarchaeum sp.]|nr:excinuclease ABC subunit UvrC [Candidatus ainarchaeum sp.]
MISPSEISFLPNSPGCYMFFDETGTVIYVGKAKDLKKRVSSYFQKTTQDIKTRTLVNKIKSIDFVLTKNEVEAFLLENNLIKKYYPYFNLDLKDSRRYAYLHFTDDKIPILEVARIRNKTGEYFGPFVSGMVRKTIMDSLSWHFKIFTYKPSIKVKKTIDVEDYNKKVNQVKKILKGNTDELIDELTESMKLASKNNNFEYALTLRNQIEAIKTLKEKQNVEFSKKVDAHVINYEISAGEVHLLLFNIRNGVVEEKQEFVFSEKEDFLEEFLLQFYDSVEVPEEIILPIELSDALVEYLSNKSKKKIKIIVPKIGEKKEVLDFVAKNITATFFAGSERVTELKKALNLEKLPRVIECFDISHLAGTNTVASMSNFKDGFPDKSNYRKFKIKANANSDDLLAMEEVLRRRYSGSLSKTMKKPDLIVIDGGPTQLAVSAKVLEDLKLSIPIVSLAKQFEEIYFPNNNTPLRLDKKNKGLLLLQAVRDETHRFGNAYRKVLKRKEVFGK